MWYPYFVLALLLFLLTCFFVLVAVVILSLVPAQCTRNIKCTLSPYISSKKTVSRDIILMKTGPPYQLYFQKYSFTNIPFVGSIVLMNHVWTHTYLQEEMSLSILYCTGEVIILWRMIILTSTVLYWLDLLNSPVGVS